MEHDALLRETVARHFDAARIENDEIDLGFASLRMRCSVNQVKDIGSVTSASLYFQLWGGRLGEEPVFASASGYGATATEAIIGGACNWACAFGPVLRAAIGGEDLTEVTRFDVRLDGQTFRAFIDDLDRAVLFAEGDPTTRIAPARRRFAPRSWLAREVIDSGRLPLLSADRPTVLSVFVSDMADRRMVEVKVDGVDWPGMDPVFAGPASEPPGAAVLLRELAVLVPTTPPPPLSRDLVRRTAHGLSESSPRRRCVDWQGWQHHDGELAPTLTEEAIGVLEGRVGPLPPDYRSFLASVGASGLGPGYGLLSPVGHGQASLARGRFAWSHDSETDEPARGVLALAHGGCGVMWLLVLEGSQRGEVWVDARGSDGRVRRVASTFTAWYRDWLTSTVRDAVPWLQWDSACCATPRVFSQLIASIEQEGISGDAIHVQVGKRIAPGAMRLMSSGSSYFASQAILDPCHGCVNLAVHFNCGTDIFQRGDEPLAHLAPDPKPGPGLLARLRAAIRRR